MGPLSLSRPFVDVCTGVAAQLSNANQANLEIVLVHAHESQDGMAKDLIAAINKFALYWTRAQLRPWMQPRSSTF